MQNIPAFIRRRWRWKGGGVIYTKMLEYMTKMFCLKLSLQWDELKWLFVKNVILYIYKNETMKIFWYIRI